MNIEKLSKCGKLTEFAPNEIICIENQPGETAYLLLKGNAKVKVGSFKDNAKDVAIIPAGAIFGEMSLLEGNPRSATVTSGDEPTTVLEIGKDDFLALMKTEPELAYNMLRTMYTRIEDSLTKHRGYLVAYAAEVRHEPMYVQISKLTLQQFTDIVKQDDKHALRLLKYMSHILTVIDDKVREIGG